MLLIPAFILFAGIDYIFQTLMSVSSWPAFIITFFIILYFRDFWQKRLERLFMPQRQRLIANALKILQLLNYRLNSSRRYSEVLSALEEAFNKLFVDQPFAFFIADNGECKLANSSSTARKKLRNIKLQQEYFSFADEDPLVVDVGQSSIPEKIQKKLLQVDLTQILPFYGQNRLAAVLFVNYQRLHLLHIPPVQTLFEQIQKKTGLILENSALFADLEKKHSETRKIIEVSRQLLSSFDTQKILDFIISTLKTLIPFNAAAIFILDKSGKRLLMTSSYGYDLRLIKNLRLKVGQGACGWVAQTKQIIVMDDVHKSSHYYEIRKQTRSQLSIPMVLNNDVLGVICLESDQPAFFRREQLEVLQIFTSLAVIAIHNARQLKIHLAKKAMEDELLNAGNVQKQLLVQRLPHMEHLTYTALNRPSLIMSGDLYDFIRFNNQTIGMAIGDVSGKGAAAALMMALILAGLRSHSKAFHTACDVVYRLNNLLTETTLEGRYATFFYGIFEIDAGRIIYTNAGHNPPILIKANGKTVRLEKGGIVLGYLQDWQYIQEEVGFYEGDLFVAYTDGVTECMNKSGEEFGEERLLTILQKHRRLAVFDIKKRILDEIYRFSGKQTPTDDITLIIAKRM